MMRDFVQQHGAKFLVGMQDRDAALKSFLTRRKSPSRFWMARREFPTTIIGIRKATHRGGALKALFAAQNVLAPAAAQASPTIKR